MPQLVSDGTCPPLTTEGNRTLIDSVDAKSLALLIRHQSLLNDSAAVDEDEELAEILTGFGFTKSTARPPDHSMMQQAAGCLARSSRF